MTYEFAFWILVSITGGYAVAQVFRFLPSKSQKAIDRILFLEEGDRANTQADLKRIATALEFFTEQFPGDKGPYFERLLITFQEWIRPR